MAAETMAVIEVEQERPVRLQLLQPRPKVEMTPKMLAPSRAALATARNISWTVVITTNRSQTREA